MPLQTLLFFVVKQVAAGALAKAGGALFDKIHHPDEPEKDELKLNEKILDEIRALGVSIEEVKVAIAALSNQIAEAVVALRKDDLRESASAIGTQYATVNDILRAIQKVKADTTLPEKERQAKFTVLYDRLKDCLKEAAESVPAYLDLINDALADPTMNSLVQEIAGVVLKKSVDVVHYYYQTMTEVCSPLFADFCSVLSTESSSGRLLLVRRSQRTLATLDGSWRTGRLPARRIRDLRTTEGTA